MSKLVQGVGINDRSCPTKQGGKHTKEYSLWKDMLKRCYNTKYQEGKPAYIGCNVSDNFKHYTYFFEWCQNQIGFGGCDFSLDKDLIYKGNKEYNENNCVFIPQELNNLILKNKSIRGLLPIGVCKHGVKFQTGCKINGVRKYIGLFDTPELAFQAYKAFKEAHIKELAEKYKDTIDERAYLALMNYEVHIDD